MKLRTLAARVLPHSTRLKWNAYEALNHGEPELRLLPALCAPNKTSLDIGACRGVYACVMRKYSERVLALEPQPQYADFLRKALPSVDVLECAASDSEAEAVLHVPVANNDAGMAYIKTDKSLQMEWDRRIRVRTRTIDSLDLTKIGFIKIDVEGHELAVLQGAERTIACQRPNLLIEAEERHRQDAVASVGRFLQPYGYSGWFLHADTLHSIAEFNPTLHQNPAAVPVRPRRPNPGSPAYVNNFIFAQQGSISALHDIVQKRLPGGHGRSRIGHPRCPASNRTLQERGK